MMTDVVERVLCDMHVHSDHSHDGKSSLEELIAESIRRGISVLAITDHCDVEYYLPWDQRSVIRGSVSEVEALAPRAADRLTLLTGIEIGEGIWSPEHTEEILGDHRYDVVIGSVHAVRYGTLTDPYSKIDFATLSEEALHGYLCAYFEDLYEMVETSPCDVVAHLTCPLRYINGIYRRNVDVRRYEMQIERVLRSIIAKGRALEVNTSGVGSAYGTFMPDAWIVRRYFELGGRRITLGSDAHTAERLAAGFDEALTLLSSCGFDTYYYYRDRRPVPCPIVLA